MTNITHYVTLFNCYVMSDANARIKRNLVESAMRIVFDVEIEGLGQALKQARVKAKMSVVLAGERAQMSGANFSRIENEETKGVPIQTFIKAAKAVDPDLSSRLGEWIKVITKLEAEIPTSI